MTPHNEAKKDEIAKIVLMPGDPLRAKFIAETYLTDYKLVNTVRNMYAYTGFYHDKRITIMASGMGAPSMGIYSYELFKFYDVDIIIRIGSAGAYSKDLDLYDIVLVKGCFSESSYAKVQNGCSDNMLYADKELNEHIQKIAKENNVSLHYNNIYSSDVFYKENNDFQDLVDKYGCCCVEMESFALFHNANILGKKAACLLTISDSLVTHEVTTSEEREKSFTKMIELALKSIEKNIK